MQSFSLHKSPHGVLLRQTLKVLLISLIVKPGRDVGLNTHSRHIRQKHHENSTFLLIKQFPVIFQHSFDAWSDMLKKRAGGKGVKKLLSKMGSVERYAPVWLIRALERLYNRDSKT